MGGREIIRIFLFIVFFGIGAAALSGSVLCDDLTRYYRNRQLLEDAQESLNQLKALNTDYDALLNQLEEDPNLFKRIAPAAIGIEREEPNTVYPSATPEQLAIARRVLSEQAKARKQANAAGSNQRPDESKTLRSNGALPVWLTRCSEPRRRIVLFSAGAGLILISFICFSPTGQRPTKVGSATRQDSRRARPNGGSSAAGWLDE